jgi:hypothetical protein
MDRSLVNSRKSNVRGNESVNLSKSIGKKSLLTDFNGSKEDDRSSRIDEESKEENEAHEDNGISKK